MSKKLGSKRYEFVSSDMNGIKVFDNTIKTLAALAITPQGIHCHYCDCDSTIESKCPHTEFMLTVPDLAKTVRQKIKAGWNLPDPP